LITQKNELFALIKDNVGALSKESCLGKISGSKAMIDTNGSLPPPQALRPVGPEKHRIIEETIDQLLAWDVIEESNLGTASPVVLV